MWKQKNVRWQHRLFFSVFTTFPLLVFFNTFVDFYESSPSHEGYRNTYAWLMCMCTGNIIFRWCRVTTKGWGNRSEITYILIRDPILLFYLMTNSSFVCHTDELCVRAQRTSFESSVVRKYFNDAAASCNHRSIQKWNAQQCISQAGRAPVFLF